MFYKINPSFRLLLIIFTGIIVGKLLLFNVLTTIIFLSLSIIISIFKLIKKEYSFTYFIGSILVGICISNMSNINEIHLPKKVIPEFKAYFIGTVTKIIRQDEYNIRCIVNGEFDANILPPINNSGVILTIHRIYKGFSICEGAKISSPIFIHTPKIKQIPTDFDEISYSDFNDAQWIGDINAKKVKIKDLNNESDWSSKRISNKLEILFRNIYSEKNWGLAYALITGDQSKIDFETKQNFQLTGTIHVIAVSGLHIGLISTIIYLLLSFIRIRWMKFIIFLILVILYIGFTGYQPSAIRAGLMSILIFFAYLVQRRISLLNILSFSVILIILFTPKIIHSVGFQLSVFSILGITVFFEPIMRFLNEIAKITDISRNYYKSSIGISLSASICVTPLIAYYFGFISFLSPIANLLVIPLMMLGMIFSIFSIPLAFININLAMIYAKAAECMFDISNSINSFIAKVPFGQLKSHDLLQISIILSLGLILIIFSKSKRQFIFRLCSLVLVFGLISINNNYLSKPGVEIIARNNFVCLILPYKYNEMKILIIDRKPKIYPQTDYSLTKYILGKNENISLYVNGNSGIAISDEIKKYKNIKEYNISLDNINKINGLLNSKEKFVQIIKL